MADENKPVTTNEMRVALSELREGLSEQMRDIETSLLRAFHSYAQSDAAQHQKHTAYEAATEIRLSALESRVLELETRRRN